MRFGFSKAGMVAASVLLLAACSEDAPPLGPNPGGGAGQLTASEAAAINEAIVGKAFQGWGFDQAAPSVAPGGDGEISFNSAPITIDFSVDVTTSCELGGTFGVSGNISGSIDDQTFDGTLGLDVMTSMSACSFPAEETSFTMTTNPDLHLQGSVSWDQSGQVGQAVFTYDGGLTWSSADGRAGSCLIDLSITLEQDGTEAAAGTVCGHSV